MEVQEIKELMAQFDASSLREFDLKEGNFSLYFNKNKQTTQLQQLEEKTVPQSFPSTPELESPVVTVAPQSKKNLPVANIPEVKAGTTINSPVVGIVYLQPSPDKPAFKSVGDQVKKGEVVCIVEAMKVMNEIVAEVTGEITAILVENEAVVEFNQPLFTVKEG